MRTCSHRLITRFYRSIGLIRQIDGQVTQVGPIRIAGQADQAQSLLDGFQTPRSKRGRHVPFHVKRRRVWNSAPLIVLVDSFRFVPGLRLIALVNVRH